MTIWNLQVDRVRVVGVRDRALTSRELRSLVSQAVQRALETAPLPGGRAMRARVEVRVPSLAGSAVIADAVAQGVVRATIGGVHE